MTDDVVGVAAGGGRKKFPLKYYHDGYIIHSSS
jgi:hypothetical protein